MKEEFESKMTASDQTIEMTKSAAAKLEQQLVCGYCCHYVMTVLGQILKKVKGLDIYIPPLTGKPEQQRFTTRSGVLVFK